MESTQGEDSVTISLNTSKKCLFRILLHWEKMTNNTLYYIRHADNRHFLLIDKLFTFMRYGRTLTLEVVLVPSFHVGNIECHLIEKNGKLRLD